MRKDLRKKFKKYLESKSALCIYMKMYRERHLAVNPARLEDFLEQTTPNLAIPASLNQRAGYRLTFNQAHTKLIAESGLKLVALGQSRTTGEILLMINNQRGITYNISEHHIRSASKTMITHHNVVVSAKDLCQKLSRMLCIETDYELLECKMVSKNVNMIIFKLDTKQ